MINNAQCVIIWLGGGGGGGGVEGGVCLVIQKPNVNSYVKNTMKYKQFYSPNFGVDNKIPRSLLRKNISHFNPS